MAVFIAQSLLLAGGLAALLLAGHRRWQPPLAVTLGVAVALRLATLGLAASRGWQPYDFVNDFPAAAQSVMHHADPLVTARAGGWHFLPPMAYLNAGLLKLGGALGVGWPVIGRIVPVAADVCNVLLVGRLATRLPATRRFQYACNPIAILVCAVHGQIEPVALTFALAALVLARHRRAAAAGAAIGMAIAVNSWPVLILPGVVLFVRGLRARTTVLVGAVVVPLAFLLTVPLASGGGFHEVFTALRDVLTTRPVTGTWGWSAAIAVLNGSHGAPVVSSALGLAGDVVVLAAFALLAYRWRASDPLALVGALILGFLVCTSRFGAQYLLWAVPFVTLRPTRSTGPVLVAAGAWAGAGYLYLTTLSKSTYPSANMLWALSSLVVVVGLLILLLEGRPDVVRRLRLTASLESSPAMAE